MLNLLLNTTKKYFSKWIPFKDFFFFFFNAKLASHFLKFIHFLKTVHLQPCAEELYMNNPEYEFKCLEVKFRLCLGEGSMSFLGLSVPIFLLSFNVQQSNAVLLI